MSYIPTPGTIPFRAIAWLEAQGADAETRLAPWAEALGVDWDALGKALEAPLKHGLVLKFAKRGTQRPLFYRLQSNDKREPAGLHIEAGLQAKGDERKPDDGLAPPPALSHAAVLALARNGGAAQPFDAWATRKPDGVDIDRVNRVADCVTVNTPRRALTAMQARGEVMESEACTSATDRGGNAAPAGAAGPAFHTPREGRDVLKAEPRGRRYVDSPAASEAPTHSTALNGTAETPAPGQRETASRAERSQRLLIVSGDDLRAARSLDDSLQIELGTLVVKLTRAQALRIVALYGVPA